MPKIPPTTNNNSLITLKRLRGRLADKYSEFAKKDPQSWETFLARFDIHFPRLFELLFAIYSNYYDFFYYLEELSFLMAESWMNRPEDLKQLDQEREADPEWFLSNNMLGGVCYADLFSEDLQNLKTKIPYFKELGLTYLHLMPLFKCPEKENDGGYAVSSYREVRQDLGTMQELRNLANELRKQGISLVLDFVFNHTSNEHEWAIRAINGDLEMRAYYHMFPDRIMPDAYEKNLREIFPEEHPGAFTYFPEIQKWVWTTFHSYQWDLNYANQAVFNSMAAEMLFLANVGVEALRLDAVAFIWKQLGTSCENLPEAHQLIQAFNAIARIVAPTMVFKSEAIVHPDDVIKYIHPEECSLSYNPLLMALLWNSLATREVRLLELSLRERYHIPKGCSWVNYVRCHDDIGWTFSDEDAYRLGINGHDHRQFLNAFYTGRFPGSFARGIPFQENPKTGDARISGTCASLAGLEKAIKEETDLEIDLSIRRILLIHSIILTIGGIPLFYLGDEIGTLNDYSFRNDPAKATDSRWVHRPHTNWDKINNRNDPTTIEGRIFQNLKTLINIRKQQPAFSGTSMDMIQTSNNHVLGFVRSQGNQRVLVFANFTEDNQPLSGNLLRLYGLSYQFKELLTGQPVSTEDLTLAPYQVIMLKCE